jgi:hypothetical protein
MEAANHISNSEVKSSDAGTCSMSDISGCDGSALDNAVKAGFQYVFWDAELRGGAGMLVVHHNIQNPQTPPGTVRDRMSSCALLDTAFGTTGKWKWYPGRISFGGRWTEESDCKNGRCSNGGEYTFDKTDKIFKPTSKEQCSKRASCSGADGGQCPKCFDWGVGMDEKKLCFQSPVRIDLTKDTTDWVDYPRVYKSGKESSMLTCPNGGKLEEYGVHKRAADNADQVYVFRCG